MRREANGIKSIMKSLTRQLAFRKPSAGVLIPAAALLLGLAGCDESARRPIQARPQEAAPPAEVLGPLPLDSQRSHGDWRTPLPPRGAVLLTASVAAHS